MNYAKSKGLIVIGVVKESASAKKIKESPLAYENAQEHRKEKI